MPKEQVYGRLCRVHGRARWAGCGKVNAAVWGECNPGDELQIAASGRLERLHPLSAGLHYQMSIAAAIDPVDYYHDPWGSRTICCPAWDIGFAASTATYDVSCSGPQQHSQKCTGIYSDARALCVEYHLSYIDRPILQSDWNEKDRCRHDRALPCAIKSCHPDTSHHRPHMARISRIDRTYLSRPLGIHLQQICFPEPLALLLLFHLDHLRHLRTGSKLARRVCSPHSDRVHA